MINSKIFITIILATLLTGCADMIAAMQPQPQRPIFTDQQFRFAAKQCGEKVLTSTTGSCMEAHLTQFNTDWTSHPNAIYVSMLFSYLNAVGSKVESGAWTEARGESELASFVNRLKIQMAERDRINEQYRQVANQAANQAAYQAGFNAFARSTSVNTGITCIRSGNLVQCN